MKKLFFISGFVVLAFGILFLTGIVDFSHTVSRSLSAGNRLYASEKFDEALTAYDTGLQKEPGNPALSFNAAQASYRLKAYDKAIEYYGKASGETGTESANASPTAIGRTTPVDLYLNWGNSFLRLGDSTEDMNQKLQYYTNALETYKQGILIFPQSVELKYNYEFVLEKNKELQDSMENQQQKDNQENPEDQDQSQQGGGQESQDENQQGQQSNEQNNPDEGQPGSQGNTENPEDDPPSGDEDKNSSEQNQESGQQQNPEDQQSEAQGEQPEESQGQQDEASTASDEEENDDKTSSAEMGSVQNSSEIDQILQMLEQQEEEALKNNQQIRDSGKEEEHDW